MMDWMIKEAARSGIPKHGYCGGLMFDEVSIQPDLQLYSKKVDCKLPEFVNMQSEGNFLYQQRHDKCKLATHVMQFFS
jgi:cobyrinic acid a,c-diamide synthase